MTTGNDALSEVVCTGNSANNITDSSESNKKFQFSFEVFPPKKTTPIEKVYETVAELSTLNPDYISVTYGAGGGAATAAATVEICSLIKNTYHTETVAHLPGINLTKGQVESVLQRLRAHNIMRVLALRGDRRPDETGNIGTDAQNIPQEGDFCHASELVSFIKGLEIGEGFEISAACYPEVHDEAPDAETDLRHLKEKVDAGTSLLISQLFFDNDKFYDFLQRASTAGIAVPIQAGIMPLINVRQARHIVKLCNPHIPQQMQDIFDKYQDNDDSFRAAGIDYASAQIADLIEQGVDGVHLYTMNSPATARAIMQAVQLN